MASINDRFAVRVIVAGGVAADLRAFAVTAIRGESEVIHGDKNASLNRLEAVAHVRKRTSDDDAHRIVEVRLAHFCFDIDRKQYGCVLFVRHVSSLYCNGPQFLRPGISLLLLPE